MKLFSSFCKFYNPHVFHHLHLELLVSSKRTPTPSSLPVLSLHAFPPEFSFLVQSIAQREGWQSYVRLLQRCRQRAVRYSGYNRLLCVGTPRRGWFTRSLFARIRTARVGAWKQKVDLGVEGRIEIESGTGKRNFRSVMPRFCSKRKQ